MLPDFIAHYEMELEDARKECSAKGLIERNLAALPGITEQRFGNLQDIEAVLRFLEIQQRVVQQKHYKKYLENYGRSLVSRDAERYAAAEQEVVDMDLLINQVALLRNQYLGIIKALESKNWTLSNIAKLRIAGFEDATI